MPNQSHYYQGKTYQQDYRMNCAGDCLVTANWHRLVQEEAGKVVACPKEIPLGSQIYIEDYGIVTCHDRWWAIKKKWSSYHLDLWTWIWNEGLYNLEKNIVYNPWPRKWYIIT